MSRRAHGTRRRKSVRLGGDRGLANAVIIVTMTVVMLLAAGLAFDGSRVLAARRDAVDVARQAARAGAQAASEAALRDGRVEVDGARAVVAADRFVAVSGHHGSARVEGDEVVVTVAMSVELPLLSSVGVARTTVSGTGSAHLVRGIWEAEA